MALLVTLALTVIAFRGPSGVAVGTARAARKDLIVPILSDGTPRAAAPAASCARPKRRRSPRSRRARESASRRERRSSFCRAPS